MWILKDLPTNTGDGNSSGPILSSGQAEAIGWAHDRIIEMLAALQHAQASLKCVKENGFDQSGAVGSEVLQQVDKAINGVTDPAF